MNLLVLSITVSIVLTVLLNVAVRAIPGAGRRVSEWIEELTTPAPGDDDRRVRVVVPWRAMIVGSILLTVAVNVLLWAI